MELHRVDPCNLSTDWHVVYKDKIGKVTDVHKDEHNAPYSVKVENLAARPLVFWMNNALFFEPVIDPHAYHQIILGMKPVELEWRVNPDLVERILAPEMKGQLIGTIQTRDKEFGMYAAYVGRFTGNYHYDRHGTVLAAVDPKFFAQTHCSHDQKLVGKDYHVSYKNELLIGDLDTLLPDTKATLEFLESMKEHAIDQTEFYMGLEALQEAIKVPA